MSTPTAGPDDRSPISAAFALRDETDAMMAEIGPEFAALLIANDSSQFECGDWRAEDNDESYEEAFESCSAARHALVSHILSALRSARRDTAAPPEANYDAGVKAYNETVAFWAPECMSSPDHIAKLVENIVDAALSSPPILEKNDRG